MRNYIKPKIQYIELRVEESLAGSGSILVYSRDDIVERTIGDSWFGFWLRLLHK